MQGQLVVLTPLERKNIEQLRQWRNRPDIRSNTNTHHLITSEQQEKWFENCVANSSNSYHFEIRPLQTQELIGYCSLTRIDWIARVAEFSIYLGDLESYGKGYGSDALSTLLKYGFDSLNLNRIWGQVFSTNPKALKLYQRLRFQEEGQLRQAHWSSEGFYADIILVGILREDYYSEIEGAPPPSYADLSLTIV